MRCHSAVHTFRPIFAQTFNNEAFQSVYGLPFGLAKIFKGCAYLDFIELSFNLKKPTWPNKPKGQYISSEGDCCGLSPRSNS